MRLLKNSLLGFGLLGLVVCGYSQEVEEQYNPNSIHPIAKYEQHFKKRTWYRIDLKERQNKGFFAKNAEISKFIIEMVQSGAIRDDQIYNNDSLASTMSKDEFMTRLEMNEAVEYDPYDPDAEYYEGDQVSFNGTVYTSRFDENIGRTPLDYPDDWEADPQAGKADLYLTSQISIMEIAEDQIFDKRRGRLYHDVQSIKLVVPGSETPTGVDNELAVFKFKDLERLFRENPEKAIWFNQFNSAQHKNFADAFLLRLFHGVLVKVENPDDLYIRDIYSKSLKEGVMASQWLELELMEKEHNLWEF